MPIVHELPLPPCVANAPAAFQRRHDATQQFDPGVTWGRLHVRLIAADSNESLSTESALAHWYGKEMHHERLRRGSALAADSVPAGPVAIHANAIGYFPWRDTVLVRAGYADTVVAGLARACPSL